MESHSYTRVTLALDIIGKVTDGDWKGYHELAVMKHQIDLHDTISIEPASRLTLECDDPHVPCDGRNICCQAVELLKKEYNIEESVRIVLKKRIPVMGGLAGGSANAATTLKMLNDLWQLHLSKYRLMELGRKLGMDVPYYFIGGTAMDNEAGGHCEPIPTSLMLTFILAIPDFGISTTEAYRGLEYETIGCDRRLTEAMKHYCRVNDRQGVVLSMHNDFEHSVFQRHPRLEIIKKELCNAGCTTSLLSGSGSTLFGVASNKEQAVAIQKNMSCRTIIASTLMPPTDGKYEKEFVHGEND